MKDKQINLKLPDDLWLAAKIKAAQNRHGPVCGDPWVAAQGVGGRALKRVLDLLLTLDCNIILCMRKLVQ